ncbi:MAG TPA: S8 family serine peptidase [Thermoanaerobaculia bacterium]|jgi:subtilisin|nr:S8 family serine peptidase [Thermoanaerobaculia bacterium]
MGTRKTTRPRTTKTAAADDSSSRTSASVEEMLLAALGLADDNFQTGRYLATFKEGAMDAGAKPFAASQGMRVADARDFANQAIAMESVADADAVVFPAIGVALIGGGAARARGLTAAAEVPADSNIASIDPEYFVFSDGVTDAWFRALDAGTGSPNPGEYLRGFLRAAETIAKDLGDMAPAPASQNEEQALALGATWGLIACNVPSASRSGSGIKVAVLDTGLDLGHPDFAGRTVVSATFARQPVQDLHGHGTHCIGTSCGPKSPAGSTPRYGIAYRAAIYAGKVLSNSGSSVGGSVLAGMNWAVANKCDVISMSLGSPRTPVQPYYTAAGQSALNNGLLMIAAAGNDAGPTGAPANSPTIMSVAAVDTNLIPATFSDLGKVEIAGPGVNIFSSVPRPTRYGYKSGTSMATPHVAGCAALWAETSATLRGMLLWNKLLQTAKSLSSPASLIGSGLVQAP